LLQVVTVRLMIAAAAAAAVVVRMV
jgi:hypothetical protein